MAAFSYWDDNPIIVYFYHLTSFYHSVRLGLIKLMHLSAQSQTVLRLTLKLVCHIGWPPHNALVKAYTVVKHCSE